MSLHISVVAIEGDHLEEIADILLSLDYIIEDSFTVQTGEEAAKQLSWRPDADHVAKVAYTDCGWTYIVDPELTVMLEETWIERTQQWNNRVFAWICEGVSGSYGIMLYERGVLKRDICVVESEVHEGCGPAIPEEINLDWTEAFEDDIMKIARRIGADYDYLADREYLVFQLNESAMDEGE